MSSRSAGPECIEVTLGAGTMSPDVEFLPLAEALNPDGKLKPEHELVRLARLRWDLRYPPTPRQDTWAANMRALRASLPPAQPVRSRILPMEIVGQDPD
jgi:hypothetical protein